MHSWSDNLRRFFPNSTVVSSDKLGDMDSGTMMFDGCLGRLQRNESDVTLALVPFPVLGTGVLHGTTASASKVIMWSVYNNTAVPSDTDVMDAFHSFTDQLWFLIFLTSAFLTVVLFLIFYLKLLSLPQSNSQQTTRQRTRRCVDQALLIVIANVLKQHTSYSFRGKLLRRRMILFLIAVFSFLIMFYFTSMIKTEMVVQKSPETISSYEELLAKPNVKPMWTNSEGIHWFFKNAERNTAERRIWERAEKLGVDSCLLKTDADAKRMIEPLNTQKAVWFGHSYMMGVMITNVCAFHHSSGLHTDANMWFRSDEKARETLNVMMLSAALHPESVKKFNRIIEAEFEHHLMYQAFKRMEFSLFPNDGSKWLRECVANTIIHPDYEIEGVSSHHYSRLFVLSGYVLLFCLLVLVSEAMRNVYCRFASKKKRDMWTLVLKPRA